MCLIKLFFGLLCTSIYVKTPVFTRSRAFFECAIKIFLQAQYDKDFDFLEQPFFIEYFFWLANFHKI